MTNERRRYFRVNDIVTLHASIVSGDELEKRLAEFSSNRLQYLARYQRKNTIETNPDDLQAIRDKMPGLARYLGDLQAQIDYLNQTLLPEKVDYREVTIEVNLSAQGISFPSNEIFKPVDLVELVLTLTPSRQKLVTFARVVLVEDNEGDIEDGKYQISLDFEHIHETDREILVKHVHSKQQRSLNAVAK